MLDGLLAGLRWTTQFSDPLAWLVLAAFLVGVLLEFRSRGAARAVLVGAWVGFAVFWFTLIYHFAFVQKSIIEGVGTVAAVPLSLYVGYLLWSGRDSLFVLSRAVAGMGLVFMPFEAIPVLQEFAIETVTQQTAFLMRTIGVEPTVLTWPEAASRVAEAQDLSTNFEQGYRGKYDPYLNTFYWETGDGYPITYTILMACTGVGSMAIFAGLIGAVRAPFRRKARAFLVAIPTIYALNLVRNVFIGVSFGQQRMQFAEGFIMSVFATSDPHMVSFYWADRILAQTGSVIALVAITWLVVRELPEVLIIVEDVLYVLTGSEYDLAEALDVEVDPESPGRPVRADGDGRE